MRGRLDETIQALGTPTTYTVVDLMKTESH
jgi:hypothetical protein